MKEKLPEPELVKVRKAPELIDQDKLMDMSILFGMPKEEVDKIAQHQMELFEQF